MIENLLQQKGIGGQIKDKVIKTNLALLEYGASKPMIHKTFPLEQAADAHRLMESSD